MKEESAFRAATAALLLSAAVVSGYHRHKAEAASTEKISAVEEEGLFHRAIVPPSRNTSPFQSCLEAGT